MDERDLLAASVRLKKLKRGFPSESRAFDRGTCGAGYCHNSWRTDRRLVLASSNIVVAVLGEERT
jgi:hypothetical protein